MYIYFLWEHYRNEMAGAKAELMKLSLRTGENFLLPHLASFSNKHNLLRTLCLLLPAGSRHLESGSACKISVCIWLPLSTTE